MSEQVPEQAANTANVYGMEVPIVADIERGEMITDVLILSRFVMFDDDGKPFDGIIFDSTPGTTQRPLFLEIRNMLRTSLSFSPCGRRWTAKPDG